MQTKLQKSAYCRTLSFSLCFTDIVKFYLTIETHLFCINIASILLDRQQFEQIIFFRFQEFHIIFTYQSWNAFCRKTAFLFSKVCHNHNRLHQKKACLFYIDGPHVFKLRNSSNRNTSNQPRFGCNCMNHMSSLYYLYRTFLQPTFEIMAAEIVLCRFQRKGKFV